MHRIPKTPIGLVIRKSRFRAISSEISEVVAALVGLRRAYSAAGSTPHKEAALVFGWPDDFEAHIERLTERAAVMRGTSTDAIASETAAGTFEQSSEATTAAREADIERALAKLERRLRWLIEHTKSEPATRLLYVEALISVERQQWRLEQQQRVTSSDAKSAGASK